MFRAGFPRTSDNSIRLLNWAGAPLIQFLVPASCRGRFGGHGNATQIFVQFAVADELFDMRDSFEALPFKLFDRKSSLTISVVQLFDAAPRRPLGFKSVQPPPNVVAVHTITPQIRSSVGRELHLTVRNDFFYQSRNFT